jgi:hypothetical protein
MLTDDKPGALPKPEPDTVSAVPRAPNIGDTDSSIGVYANAALYTNVLLSVKDVNAASSLELSAADTITVTATASVFVTLNRAGVSTDTDVGDDVTTVPFTPPNCTMLPTTLLAKPAPLSTTSVPPAIEPALADILLTDSGNVL